MAARACGLASGGDERTDVEKRGTWRRRTCDRWWSSEIHQQRLVGSIRTLAPGRVDAPAFCRHAARESAMGRPPGTDVGRPGRAPTRPADGTRRRGPLRSASVDEPTFRVSELTDAVQLALDVCFPDEVWVQGEISSLKRSAAGHVYFQLIEPGEAGAPPVAQIAVTLFAKARADVNATLRGGGGIRMTDGVEIRIRGRLGLYGPQGRLQLRMSAIDPEYTLGRLAGDRERLLQALAGRRAARPQRPAARRASPGGDRAGHQRRQRGRGRLPARAGGQRAGLGGRRRRLPGPGRRRRALDRRRARAPWPPIRSTSSRWSAGGGARTDLATFDGALVAREIAVTARPGDHRHRPRDRLAASPTRSPTPRARPPPPAPPTWWPGPAASTTGPTRSGPRSPSRPSATPSSSRGG